MKPVNDSMKKIQESMKPVNDSMKKIQESMKPVNDSMKKIQESMNYHSKEIFVILKVYRDESFPHFEFKGTELQCYEYMKNKTNELIAQQIIQSGEYNTEDYSYLQY